VFPGNVYEHQNEEIEQPPFNALIADSLFIPLVASEFFELKNQREPGNPKEYNDFKNDNNKAYKTFEKEKRDQIKLSSRFVSIEVSPICDFAQKKWKLNRICPAILWNADFALYLGKSDNLYVSPLLLIDDVSYNLIIDLRYFSSHPFNIFKESKPIFNLKHSFLTDIQSLLSRHINRPGITSLN
jgi:hypothetical protein